MGRSASSKDVELLGLIQTATAGNALTDGTGGSAYNQDGAQAASGW
jgi:hypothetical protein